MISNKAEIKNNMTNITIEHVIIKPYLWSCSGLLSYSPSGRNRILRVGFAFKPGASIYSYLFWRNTGQRSWFELGNPVWYHSLFSWSWRFSMFHPKDRMLSLWCGWAKMKWILAWRKKSMKSFSVIFFLPTSSTDINSTSTLYRSSSFPATAPNCYCSPRTPPTNTLISSLGLLSVRRTAFQRNWVSSTAGSIEIYV